MKCFKEWPAALQRRWALLISAGAGILLVGLAVFFAFNDTMMLALSSLLTLFFVLRCIHFCRIYLRCSSSSSAPSDLPGEYWTGDGFLCLENLGRSSAD